MNRTLVGAGFSLVVLGFAFHLTRNAVAGSLAIVNLIALVVFGREAWRIRRIPPTRLGDAADWRPHQPAASSLDGVFRVRELRGGQQRSGYVIFGTNAAGFVPTSRWRFVLRFGSYLTDVEVKVFDRSTVDAALAQLSQVGGFVVDASWSWVTPRVSLWNREEKTTLWFLSPLPQHLLPRWERIPPDPVGRRKVVTRMLVGAGSFSLVLLLVGVLLWRLYGDIDYLIGFGVWACLVACAVGVGVLVGLRQNR